MFQRSIQPVSILLNGIQNVNIKERFIKFNTGK